MFYRATNWDEFIAEIATSKISTPKLFRTFTLVFSEIGRGKTVEVCYEELLNQSAKTTGEHLGPSISFLIRIIQSLMIKKVT